MVKAICYRVGQFLRALTARVTEEEITQAVQFLTPQVRVLFLRQARQDQRHALDVYRTLLKVDRTNSQLLVAALLHDVGKAAAQLPPWERAFIVFLERFAPRLLDRLSRTRGGSVRAIETLPQGWRRPFVVYTHHPEIGARQLEAAGCSSLVVALVRRHEDRVLDGSTEEDRLLAALQAADGVN